MKIYVIPSLCTRYPTRSIHPCANRMPSINEAEPGQFPHLARLGLRNDEDEIGWTCSANIITQRFLLTAAHCKPADIAGVDCAETTQCEQLRGVKNFISHSKYKKSLKYHDIALVELDQDVKFNKRVLPICPYNSTDDVPAMEDMTIAGWGATQSHFQSPQLMYATVRTVSQKKCRDQYAILLKELPNAKLGQGIIDEQYCVRGALVENVSEYIDACTGDSGGPLQVEQNSNIYLVGIVSAGIGCGSDSPGLYTRVAAYFDWIKETIGKRQTAQPT
ncbi:serine protease snake-like isoform X2 [Anopheles stephensi]|uniref:serine protease snake-like isoform X2 n=1 Tax=Anopheles stephensi TaxID=30069 RepID=UPI001658B801|nr:serine protease snake-like isoform X2 [Anopheles stephensi]